MHSHPEIVHQAAFHIIGVPTVTSLHDESDPVGQAAGRFQAGKSEIPHRRDDAVILAQIYPTDGNFNEHTRYTAIVGARVEGLGQIGATDTNQINIYVALG